MAPPSSFLRRRSSWSLGAPSRAECDPVEPVRQQVRIADRASLPRAPGRQPGTRLRRGVDRPGADGRDSGPSAHDARALRTRPRRRHRGAVNRSRSCRSESRRPNRPRRGTRANGPGIPTRCAASPWALPSSGSQSRQRGPHSSHALYCGVDAHLIPCCGRKRISKQHFKRRTGTRRLCHSVRSFRLNLPRSPEPRRS